MRALARPLAWLLLPVLADLLALSPLAAAHPGGLDASGCHTNRKTGEYHCHHAASVPMDGDSKDRETRCLDDYQRHGYERTP